MDHSTAHRAHPAHHEHHAPDAEHPPAPPVSLARMAFSATLHCLIGCGIGEVLGMVIGTALGLSNLATIALAVALAFAFGYAFTIVPLRRAGLTWRAAARLALAADTASIAVMELVDNSVMWFVPGAMDSPLSSPLFWGALAFSLLVALLVAWPVNAWLLARGGGHALVHGHAHGGKHAPQHGPGQDHGHQTEYTAMPMTARDDIPRSAAEGALLQDLVRARAERSRGEAAASFFGSRTPMRPVDRMPWL